MLSLTFFRMVIIKKRSTFNNFFCFKVLYQQCILYCLYLGELLPPPHPWFDSVTTDGL